MENEDTKRGYGCIDTRCDIELDTSAMERFSEYAENTYMHGPSAIRRSKFILRRIFWVLVFIVGCVMTIFQIHELIKKFFSWQTSTTNEFFSASSLKFPAVTVCNLNPLKLSSLPLAGADIENITHILQAMPTFLSNWTSRHNSANFFSSYSMEINNSFLFLYHYMQLDKAKRKSHGHNLETMLMDCSFGGIQCSPLNFSHFVNPLYGNCYTFNSAKFSPPVRTEQSGSLFGLSLVLYIEEDEYIGDIFSTSGMRVLVHDQNNMPFPEDKGISLPTGFQTSIGISKVEVTRAKPKYGSCHTYTDDENRLYNAYSEEEELSIQYSVSACMRTCYQGNMIKHCNCCVSFLPCDSYAFTDVLRSKGGNVTQCLYSNEGQALCERMVSKYFDEEKLGCEKTCKASCWDVLFRSSSSTARYPASSAVNGIVNILKSRSARLMTSLKSMSSTEQQRFVERNILKLNIYYESMTYERVKTEPTYESEILISDIGGQFGLWLGLSMVSVFEFLEMVIDLFALILLNCRNTSEDYKLERQPNQDRQNMEMIKIKENISEPEKQEDELEQSAIELQEIPE